MVYADRPNAMDMAIEGTLRITENCVFLDSRGQSTVLWPEPFVSWDEDDRTMEVADDRGRRATLEDGDDVVFGGASARPPEEWDDPDSIVSEPHPSCPDSYVHVHYLGEEMDENGIWPF